MRIISSGTARIINILLFGTIMFGAVTANAGSTISNLTTGSEYVLRVMTPPYSNRYLRHQNSLARVDIIHADSGDLEKKDASWKVAAGLSDSQCLSFESVNFPGYFLRHANSRLRIDANNQTELFKADATFCPRTAHNGGANGVSLESFNYRNHYIRHRNGEVWLDAFVDDELYRDDASWFIDTSWSAPFANNLLRNPHAETNSMEGWQVLENGGDGWSPGIESSVEENSFQTSYAWARRTQTVDLRQQGFDSAMLDSQPPIYFAEHFEKVWCPDQYQLKIELLDANRQVIHAWDSGVRTMKGGACDLLRYGERLEHTLTHYGTGVRYIRWTDGGKDTEYWSGHYGPKLRFAYLAVLPPNLLHAPQELSSWTLLETGGNGAIMTGPSHERVLQTSWGWTRREQIVDLRANGYSDATLEAAPPIVISLRAGMVGCPDPYFLDIELLDASMRLVTDWRSGTVKHSSPCLWDGSNHFETLIHVFKAYGPNVRYIRWRDGGKDSEFRDGYYGAVLADPYVGILPVGIAAPRTAFDTQSWTSWLRPLSMAAAIVACTVTVISKGKGINYCIIGISVAIAVNTTVYYNTTNPSSDTSTTSSESFSYYDSNGRLMHSSASGIRLLDVWGEGRREGDDMRTGFADAYNINCKPDGVVQVESVCTGKTSNYPVGQPIPRLIPVNNYNNASFQLPGNFVQTITLMGAPLRPWTAMEMGRVLRKTGRIVLYGASEDMKGVLLNNIPHLRRIGGAELLDEELLSVTIRPADVYGY